MDVDAYGASERFTSTVNFHCPHCHHRDIIEVDVPEFNFNVDRMSDLESEGAFEFDCPSCGYEFLGDVICNSAQCSFFCEDDSTIFEGEFPAYIYESLEEYDIPESPAAVFHNMVKKACDLPKIDFKTGDDPQFLNRVAFVTIVTAIESYLFDQLISEIKNNDIYFLNICKNDKHLSSEKIQLSSIVSDKNYIRDYVFTHLKSIIFHNLNRVHALYECAFGFDIKKDAEHWKRLLSYMQIRHDCVHRNGKTAEGEPREDITAEFVDSVAKDLTVLVNAIQDKLNPSPF